MKTNTVVAAHDQTTEPVRAALIACWNNLPRLLMLTLAVDSAWLVGLGIAQVVPQVLQAAVLLVCPAPVWLWAGRVCSALGEGRRRPTGRTSVRVAAGLVLPAVIAATLLTMSVEAVRADGGIASAAFVLDASVVANALVAAIAVAVLPNAFGIAAASGSGVRQSLRLGAALIALRPMPFLAGVAAVIILAVGERLIGPLPLLLVPGVAAMLVQSGVHDALVIDEETATSA
jgi:hypothetical protein